MNAIIIFKSVHNGNTKKIADAIAGILGADTVGLEKAEPAKLKKYDLIGFGSGIYGGKHHDDLLGFVEKLPTFDGKNAFIFSTSASPAGNMAKKHMKLRDSLESKGFKVVDEFNCKGKWDSGPLKLIGGLSKKHPDDKDLEAARRFARGIKVKLNGK